MRLLLANSIIIIFCLLFTNELSAQLRVQRTPIDLLDSYDLYINDGSDSLYYLWLEPSAKPKAILVVLPDWGETVENFFLEAEIVKTCYENGVLIVAPTINNRFFADELTISILNTLINYTLESYKIPKKNIFFASRGIGANLVLNIVRGANTVKSYQFKPLGVMTIDPPLDFTRVWDNAQQRMYEPCKQDNANMFKLMTYYLFMQLGSAPEVKKEGYELASIFIMNNDNSERIQQLSGTYIRMFSEPDIKWNVEYNCTDVSKMNITPISSFYSEMKKQGATKFDLILTENKGYDINGNRKLNSWKLIEPDSFVKWIDKITN